MIKKTNCKFDEVDFTKYIDETRFDSYAYIAINNYSVDDIKEGITELMYIEEADMYKIICKDKVFYLDISMFAGPISIDTISEGIREIVDYNQDDIRFTYAMRKYKIEELFI